MSTNIQILFKKLAEHRRLSHAYLFSGNDEAQKAKLLAEVLHTLSIQQADHIIVCPAQAGLAPEITIAQMRELYSRLSMTSWNSPYTIAQIQEAHCMNREAQSAFLKLLEEPKGNTVLFLLTEYPDMLFDTIRSRAQEFKFYSFSQVARADIVSAEFQKLQHADLTARFAYAKKLAETPERIPHTLYQWLLGAREMLLTSLKENPQAALSLVAAMKIMGETSVLLRTTNINPRLALERVLLIL